MQTSRHRSWRALDDEALARIRRETPSYGATAHFNNGSASLAPAPVLDALAGWLDRERAVGPHRALAEHAEALGDVHASIARLLDVPADSIALAPSASAAWATALSAALQAERPVHVISAASEYAANAAYLRVALRKGRIALTVLPDDRDMPLTETLRHALQGVARGAMPVVSVPAVSATFGTVVALDGVAELVHAHDGLFLLDASHLIGQRPFDVHASGADVLLFPPRKWLRGPRGMAGAHYSARALRRLDLPDGLDVRGAFWSADGTGDATMHIREGATRFEPSEMHPGLKLAFRAASDYARQVGLDRIAGTIAQVRGRVVRAIEDACGWLPREAAGADNSALITYDVATLMSPSPRSGAEILGEALRAQEIHTAAVGLQHTPWAFGSPDARTLLRLTPHYYTSDDEIARLATALAHYVRQSAR
ncbi:aminotransferase class V-fold PLP-dependent enzyme [Cupriavidus plantarum]|uniref:Selenocysteine lyase/cysteine desulfurase n=1 Tax=Cupriavidus plantarum TaxID=942865 RepID=A0A316ERY7_9BURK|nr:aminotransferase class V-fold PLP-dependent enzyme [Cupriavidus plantarum]PWK34736.1 selenocysteine lyase/cysteine desulfurase [Cupriavidus plantarum]